MNSEESRILQEKLESTLERVKNDKQEAIRVLHAAGIMTKKGKLTAFYRRNLDK
jgi:hypothetical protein